MSLRFSLPLLLLMLAFSARPIFADPLDVTAKVAAQIKDDALSLPVDNQSLAGSPSQGDVKKLKLEYTQGTSSHTRVFAETQTALIPALPDQKLVIRKATYGPMPDPVDVTPKLLAAVKNNAITLTVNDDTLGIDPNIGTEKQLLVRYAIDGKQQIITIDQNETLHLAKPGSAKSFQILQGSYGVLQSFFDVTEIVAAAVKHNELTIGASNDTFGDPSSGDTKTLSIQYTVRGIPHSASTEEYKPELHLPLPADGPGPLLIISAQYGVLPTK